MTTKRGTSNGNSSGSAEDRRRRKLWLLETYRADVDVFVTGPEPTDMMVMPLGQGSMACRCYRCGKLLTFSWLTVDRIIPGCHGGTYRRNNIRPACGPCNSETGSRLRRKG